MCVIISLKYTAKFNPSQREGQTADYKWKQWTAQILNTPEPEPKQKFKSIPTMSASGPHDKFQYGPTDIINTVKDINSLLYTLQIFD